MLRIFEYARLIGPSTKAFTRGTCYVLKNDQDHTGVVGAYTTPWKKE